MNKTQVIVVGIILVAVVVGFFVVKSFFGSVGPTRTDTNPSNSNPSYTSISNSENGNRTGSGVGQPTGYMSLTTSSGAALQVKDFIHDSQTTKDPINPGHYLVGPHPNEGVPDATASDNPPYVIEYIESTQMFVIGLRAEPLRDTRHVMEQYLLGRLGLSEIQLCQLRSSVSVARWVNEYYAGANLGFSFCPGATPL